MAGFCCSETISVNSTELKVKIAIINNIKYNVAYAAEWRKI